MVEKYRKIQWTEHSKIKMRQYGLSQTKLINLIHKPERKEQGIVPGTKAVMKTNKSYSNNKLKLVVKKPYQNVKKSPGEVWLMYKDVKDERRVISAWRYPGVTKPGEEIPIPKEILQELMEIEF
ncbi:MAG: hypothetical protein A3D35_03680 [Candidatus Staskawiczbacteria bacterium RIFCSPHIGHO2_02_FULL_34_9]|uniref:Uncharacterized protein n=1 Tax=Candidatus Staskawiczbacteria bacterium RIFCSPHIGHO2_02_FULL_34_9 TaxID=1802206 RepID=A0A1G2HZV9_9BACT|nr:MAG: hypothetical protein A3D35_03680 [Candidatus Staskawiczbacteria bacterium RIFCSPHIGHO2_02_FULL_34_9]